MPVEKIRAQSLPRLYILVAKLDADPEGFGKDYKAKMAELLEDGHAERAPPDVPAQWILSHFAAFHPFKPGPRVVFDCAAQANGVSLNSTALSGPNLVNMLLRVFLNFRKGQFRVLGDIKRMFYNCHLPERVRRYVRYLWFPDGDTTQQPVEFQLTVHLFGGTWSPAVAAYCLQKAAIEQEALYPPVVLQIKKSAFYVDDLLRSQENREALITETLQVKECVGNQGFTLTKFFSNDRAVIEAIPPEHRAEELKSLTLKDDLPIERALGQFYNPNTDRESPWHTVEY